jgi:hypothetical protein
MTTPVSFAGQPRDPNGVVDAGRELIMFEDDFDAGVSLFENPNCQTKPLRKAPVKEELHAASN